MKRILYVGHSPDPDDAFMFYGLRPGSPWEVPFQIVHVIEDIASLNRRIKAKDLEVSAISAAAYPEVAMDYRILSTGASMGRNYGPIVVSPQPMKLQDLKGRKVALPGFSTTASLLAKLYLPSFQGVEIPFDRVFQSLHEGKADAGVIIHEGQLTYADEGFYLIVDLGKRWYEETELPLPLGLDVIRRDLGEDFHCQFNQWIRKSIEEAYAHFEDALTYALTYGRGLSREKGALFIQRYVNQDTLNMGEEGIRALKTLYQKAYGEVPPLDVVP